MTELDAIALVEHRRALDIEARRIWMRIGELTGRLADGRHPWSTRLARTAGSSLSTIFGFGLAVFTFEFTPVAILGTLVGGIGLYFLLKDTGAVRRDHAVHAAAAYELRELYRMDGRIERMAGMLARLPSIRRGP